ncbi:MAG: hypothetical protein HY331_14785 [Chloroflexi bacterium]|nr:hypothetical protein [Chloroflexota bacterium]
MPESLQRVRLAIPADCVQLEGVAGSSLARPDGKGRRSDHRDGVLRNEVLLQERYDRKEKTWRIGGFLEWHTRLDGTVTLRDVGSTGDTPDPVVIKALIRELVLRESPDVIQVKVRADQAFWNDLFAELPGFELEGKEFARPYWRNIWIRKLRR